MPHDKTHRSRRRMTSRGLIRLTVYAHEDEVQAVEEAARQHRCSVSEILRRIIRQHFRIEA